MNNVNEKYNEDGHRVNPVGSRRTTKSVNSLVAQQKKTEIVTYLQIVKIQDGGSILIYSDYKIP